jgi:hypothetical protein
MCKKYGARVFSTIVVVVLLVVLLPGASVSLAAPAAVPLHRVSLLPPNPEPGPTDSPPGPSPEPSGGGGGGGGGGEDHGGTRFPHCNSTVDGFVVNYADHSPGTGVTVEVGGPGWKAQTLADSNGYFKVGGLCAGAAYARVIIPPGALPTNPNAEALLDGKNLTQFDLGFFPPAAWLAGEPKPSLVAAAPPLVQSTPERPSIVVTVVVPRPALISPSATGLLVDVSAPRTVRAGLNAPVNVSVRNAGPGKALNTVISLPLAAGLELQEANTSKGALKIQVVPQGPGVKGPGLNAPVMTKPSTLLVDVGTLAPGQAVLVATKIKFREDMSAGSQAQLQAQAMADGKTYQSKPVIIDLTETGGPLKASFLPVTGANNYRQYFRDLLW